VDRGPTPSRTGGGATTRLAQRLGIMQTPCDEQDPAEMSIVMLDTPDQARARDAWWSRCKPSVNSGTPTFANQHAESKLLSDLCRSIDPDKVRPIDHHLNNLSIQRAAIPPRTMDNGVLRGAIWPDEYWNKPGPPDASKNPLQVSTIHKNLSRMSSNTVFLDPVSLQSRAKVRTPADL
jgi:hypothetical protein